MKKQTNIWMIGTHTEDNQYLFDTDTKYSSSTIAIQKAKQILEASKRGQLEPIESIAIGYYKESGLISDIAAGVIELVEGYLIDYWEDLDRDESFASDVLNQLYNLGKEYKDLEDQIKLVVEDWLQYYVPDALTGDIGIDTVIKKDFTLKVKKP